MGRAKAIDLDLRYKFDFTRPEVCANPFPYYEALLATSPVIVEHEIPWVLVSRYDDAAWVLADHEKFSSAHTRLPGTEVYDPFPGIPIMTFSDEPDHSRLRNVIAPALTPHRVQSLVPKFREMIDRILDVQCEGKGEVEAQQFVAQEIPLRIFGSLRAMSDAECERMNKLTYGAVAAAVAAKTEINPGKITASISPFIKELLDSREHQTGGGDPISLAIAAHECGTIDDRELFGMVMLTVVGGLSTTADAISGALYHMLSRPALHERIKRDRSLISALVEENLRFDGPTHTLPRVTRCEVEIDGLRVPKDTAVLVVLGAANRDPRKFPNPDEFDVDRKNVREHLAFGIGLHFCTGAPLGRAVANVALERLIERFPRMHLQDGFTPSYRGSPTTRGLITLPVIFN